MQLTLILFPIALAIYGAIIYLFVLLVKALRKYIKSKDVREEKKAVCRSLGEALKAHRTEKQMTQEFVAETLGVSRQAVSKWEADQAVPTMDNLMELSRLFGVPVDTLLRPDAELVPKTEDTAEIPTENGSQSVKNVNRKWKIAAIAAAGLLCVSVVCSAVSLWRVIAMQQQIDTLRMQSGPMCFRSHRALRFCTSMNWDTILWVNPFCILRSITQTASSSTQFCEKKYKYPRVL